MFTPSGIYLSLTSTGIGWICGQVLFAGGALMWLNLMCHFARGEIFQSPTMNSMGGHLSSCFSLIPYHQFQYVNNVKNPQSIPFQNKLFPPINVVEWSTKNFWDIRRLFEVYPEKKTRTQFIKSLLVISAFFLLIPFIPGFWKIFGLSYVLYFIMVEIFLSRGRLDITTRV